ncbi:MAG: putative DCC family thiol-disulfide oxidoreductase YuxK [Sphingobacteriales bacterium]|jgi:predicted DCC family thiol-disulfide oxidoreductase YuxK
MPISNTLSLDRLWLKLKYSNTTFFYNPPVKIRQIYYFLPILLGLGLVYLDSTFYKVASQMWINGLGVWLPSSLPMIAMGDNSFILNQEFLVKFLGYLTVVFEAVFIFLFFRKNLRVPLLFIGLFLHVGILVSFPIPWFALTACSMYILMVPISFWAKIFSFFKRKREPKVRVYYDAECPLCIRTKITVEFFDIFKRVKFLPVQFEAENQSALKEISMNTLYMDIHSVENGKVFSGINTYIKILGAIWYFWPISIIIRLPGINFIGRKVYSYVAENRNTERCTEDNCGYNSPSIPDYNSVKVLQNLTLEQLKSRLMYFGLITVLSIQGILIFNSTGIKSIKTLANFQQTSINQGLEGASNFVNKISRTFFGITQHAVFTDHIHFNDYNHVIAITHLDDTGKEIWLPIIDQNGQPDFYIYGANWVKWTFRVNGINVDQKKLKDGIRDFTAFWAYKNHIDLKNTIFNIKVKKIQSHNGWEKNFLRNQMQNPWFDAGTIHWNNEVFTAEIPNIESL